MSITAVWKKSFYNGIVFLANGVTSTWSAGEYYPERVINYSSRNLLARPRAISQTHKLLPRS
jgi:hypothetical protein